LAGSHVQHPEGIAKELRQSLEYMRSIKIIYPRNFEYATEPIAAKEFRLQHAAAFNANKLSLLKDLIGSKQV
jgi:hypothetical protein